MYKTPHSESTFVSADVEKLHAAVAKSTFGSEMYKTPHSESTFVSADVEKLHAAVVKSTFGSENVKNLRVREHFLKFRC